MPSAMGRRAHTGRKGSLKVLCVVRVIEGLARSSLVDRIIGHQRA